MLGVSTLRRRGGSEEYLPGPFRQLKLLGKAGEGDFEGGREKRGEGVERHPHPGISPEVPPRFLNLQIPGS